MQARYLLIDQQGSQPPCRPDEQLLRSLRLRLPPPPHLRELHSSETVSPSLHLLSWLHQLNGNRRRFAAPDLSSASWDAPRLRPRPASSSRCPGVAHPSAIRNSATSSRRRST